MGSEKSVAVVLELEPGADPIRGRLSIAPAPAREFSGWLQLSALLRLATGKEKRREDEDE